MSSIVFSRRIFKKAFLFKLDNIQSVMTEICEVNTENEFVRLEVVESERKLRYLLIWKN